MKFIHGLTISVAAGIAAGFLTSPPLPDQAAAIEPDWQPVDVVARFSHSDADLANRAIRWLGDEEAASNTATPSWRFVGVSNEPQPIALFQVAGGKSLLRIAPGSSLPDDTLVEAIDAGRVIISNGGCQRTLELFKPVPPESAANCQSSDDAEN